MRALTLHQPYASAMALGLKRIETRSWSTTYRGLVVIHAALACGPAQRRVWADMHEDRRAFHESGAQHIACLPFGRPVAVGELVDVRPVESVLVHGDADAQEERWGIYTPGRFAWIFQNVRPLRTPWPSAVTGYQGLWHWKHGPLDLADPAPRSSPTASRP